MTTVNISSRWWILAAACLAAFAINLDTTIVNVALPSLTHQLGSSTRGLQWIVDGYNLAFAALVLSAGSLGDRFGRRPVLLGGLLAFAATSGLGALCASTGQLVAARVLMGTSAALIFPTTLSVIANAFPERSGRAAAIGIWGAVTGLAVAVGPVVGGLLLSAFSWQSVFVALVPIALLAAGLAWRVVPESRDPQAPDLDLPGLAVASAAIGVLVLTIIQAPSWGWGSAVTLGGFALAAVLFAALVGVERRVEHPMIDVGLFSERAFSAASASVTVAFFALFGFIFLITQYMQAVRAWSALSTGVRILPVATSIAVASVLGARLAGRLGTRTVVCCGLVALGASFAWISRAGAATPYPIIVMQMVLMGGGLGLTTTPATESILSVLPPAKAGLGSAVNDATREAGGTLGVAVIGSVYASLFSSRLSGSAVAHLPAAAQAAARSSVTAAAAVVHAAPAGARAPLLAAVHHAFLSGLHTGCLVASGVCLLGATGALWLPGRRGGVALPAAAPAAV